jgi:hypothetical protein
MSQFGERILLGKSAFEFPLPGVFSLVSSKKAVRI